MTVQSIVDALGARRSGSQYVARCPAHDDRSPSLALTEKNGKVLLHCHAGCEQRDVIEALRARGVWADADDLGPWWKWPVTATYDYTDESGVPLYQVRRHETYDANGKKHKATPPYRPDGRGGWLPGFGDGRRVLYHLPEILESPIVFLVEGERDVETLRSHGFVATTNPGGANAWRDEYAEYLRGREVILIPDTDEAGRKWTQAVLCGLLNVASHVAVLRLDCAKDITDWFAAGHSELELITAVERS